MSWPFTQPVFISIFLFHTNCNQLRKMVNRLHEPINMFFWKFWSGVTGYTFWLTGYTFKIMNFSSFASCLTSYDNMLTGYH